MDGWTDIYLPTDAGFKYPAPEIQLHVDFVRQDFCYR